MDRLPRTGRCSLPSNMPTFAPLGPTAEVPPTPPFTTSRRKSKPERWLKYSTPAATRSYLPYLKPSKHFRHQFQFEHFAIKFFAIFMVTIIAFILIAILYNHITGTENFITKMYHMLVHLYNATGTPLI